MPDSNDPPLPPDDIAPLLRLGLDEATQMADPNATLMVHAPTPRTGGSGGSRGWQPPSVEELQKMLPQYEISAFIARGGMGAVYKGTQKTLRRPVAIKVLPPDLEDGDLQFAARFKHEAQSMAQLSHPNIVAVFDAGETPDGLLYFVMEFIEGSDVAQLIASEGIVEPLRAIQITTAVCEALAFAHEEGIIHRDIKPSNIMLDRKGRVKVADFGLAKTVNLEQTLLTGTNMAMGTPDFIAPEAMIPGVKLDGRADLYAVGVMLYQMLTGTIPRGRFELPSGVMPQMNKGFDAVVDKAMQTDREKRYSTAFEMKTAVERVSSSGFSPSPADSSGLAAPLRSSPSVSAPPDGLKPELRAKSRAPLLIAAAVVVIGAGAFFALKKSDAGRADGPPSAALAAPQWRKIIFSSANITTNGTSVNAAGELTCLDGFDLLGIRARNIAIRGELRRAATPVDGHTAVLTIQLRAGEKGTRVFGPYSQFALLQLHPQPGSTFTELSKLAYPTGTAEPGDWLPFHFATVGQRSLGSIRDLVIPPGDSPELTEPGTVHISGMGSFRNLEVLVLDDLPEAEALKLAAPVPSAARAAVAQSNIDPGAIKLWDTAEKIPADSGIVWDQGVLHLGAAGKGTGLRDLEHQGRDAVVAAEVRMNRDASSAQVSLRNHTVLSGGDFYRLELYREYDVVGLKLETVQDGTPTILHKWPLPRSYGPDEWMRMELRTVGDDITVSADGKVLGTVRDSSQPLPGYAGIYAIANGHFRNVTYIPLDKAGASKLPTITHDANYPQPAQWNDDTAELRAKSVREGTGVVEGDWLRATKKLSYSLVKEREFGSSAVRVAYAGAVSIGLRTSKSASYLLTTDRTKLGIEVYDTGKIGAPAARRVTAPFAAGFDPTAPHELVFVAQGDTLTVWLDGRQVLTTRDTTTAKGFSNVGSYNESDLGRIQKVEYAELPDRPANYPQPTQWTDATAEVRTCALDKKLGVMQGDRIWLNKTGAAPMLAGGRAFRNVAVRIIGAHDLHIHLRGNESGTASYSANLNRTTGRTNIERNVQGTVRLMDSALGTETDPEAEHEFIFAAQGDLLTVWLDGRESCSARDATLSAAGRLALLVNNLESHPERGPLIRKVEYAELPDIAPAASLSSTTPATQSPPGQWVKVFTPGEALSPSGTWKDDWIEGAKTLYLKQQGRQAARNMAVRMTIKESSIVSSAEDYPAAIYLRNNGEATYLMRLRRDGYIEFIHASVAFADDSKRELDRVFHFSKLGAAFEPAKPMTMEFAAVGNQLIGRVNGKIIASVSESAIHDGKPRINAMVPIGDIEIINLDGLPEAEALRLLGVDEKGNDVRGKTADTRTATPVWHNALTEAPLLAVISKADHTDKGYLLPANVHWDFPVPVQTGAIRVVAIRESGPHLGLQFNIQGRKDQYQATIESTLGQCKLAYLKEGVPDKNLAIKQGLHLAEGQPYELMLARIANRFHVLLNGQPILQAEQLDSTARFLALCSFRDSRTRVQKVEYINLDGLGEAEALKAAGISAAATPTTTVTGIKTLDLLAIMDGQRDKRDAIGTGQNRWEKRGEVLAYISDGHAGEIATPVRIASQHYQLEFEFKAEFDDSNPGLSRVHTYLPVRDGYHIPVRFFTDGLVAVGPGSQGAKLRWSDQPANAGRVAVQVDRRSAGKMKLEILRDGKPVDTWEGDPASLEATMASHPLYGRQSIPALYSGQENAEFRSFRLVLFEGVAEVLKPAASAPSR